MRKIAEVGQDLLWGVPWVTAVDRARRYVAPHPSARHASGKREEEEP